MYTNYQRKVLKISILIVLSLACSYLPLSAEKPVSTVSKPANATHEAIPATLPVTDQPTITIPVFIATETLVATSVETDTSRLPTKKVKTPSGNQTADPNQVCPNAQTTRLKLNGFAFLTYDPPIPNRARIGPGIGYDAKGLVKPGQVMQITSGPICSGESVWWKVVVKYTGLTGWVAEADSEQYYLEPCPVEGHCPPLTP
jgi:hypothetical protein